MRLDYPNSDKIQQGAILNCIRVSGYEGCICNAIIMTARCDLEHDKSSVLNYLPVVRFSDWIHRGMSYLLACRLKANLQSSIMKAMHNKQVSASIRQTFPLIDIIRRNSKGQEQVNLLKKLDALHLVDEVVGLRGRKNSRTKALLDVDMKQSINIVKEVIRTNIAEYYFLDAVDVAAKGSEGYVVLLRHMESISCSLASRIVSGVELEDCADSEEAQSKLCFDFDPICMVTGVLRSPDIEHLAQRFANLFVRIGLEEHDEQLVDEHTNIMREIQ